MTIQRVFMYSRKIRCIAFDNKVPNSWKKHFLNPPVYTNAQSVVVHVETKLHIGEPMSMFFVNVYLPTYLL